jgi:hypothetical protein
MKKFMTVGIFTVTLIFMMGINVGAEESATNVGVSEESPVGSENSDDVSLNGLGKPTESVNISNKDMPFAGVANNSNLFTNNFFTGASKVAIEVHNKHSSTLKYKLYKKGSLFAVETFTLKPGQSQLTALNVNSSGKYYIKFYAPSNFSGSVSSR